MVTDIGRPERGMVGWNQPAASTAASTSASRLAWAAGARCACEVAEARGPVVERQCGLARHGGGCRRSLRPRKGLASGDAQSSTEPRAWRQPSRSTSTPSRWRPTSGSCGCAIEQARRNPAFPFGAVIVRASDQQVMAAARQRGARQSDPARRDQGDPRLCRAQRPPGLGRDGALHHRRALPDVHERHHLGRHRRCRLCHLDRRLKQRRLRPDRHRLAGRRRPRPRSGAAASSAASWPRRPTGCSPSGRAASRQPRAMPARASASAPPPSAGVRRASHWRHSGGLGRA